MPNRGEVHQEPRKPRLGKNITLLFRKRLDDELMVHLSLSTCIGL
jgi:hypothetical protein